MAIVWGALRYFARTREVPQQLKVEWDSAYRQAMSELRFDQLPDILFD